MLFVVVVDVDFNVNGTIITIAINTAIIKPADIVMIENFIFRDKYGEIVFL